MILATEGYSSSGSAAITVGSGGSTSSASSSPVSTPTTPPSTGGGTVAEWGQCGGIGWSGATACVSRGCYIVFIIDWLTDLDHYIPLISIHLYRNQLILLSVSLRLRHKCKYSDAAIVLLSIVAGTSLSRLYF
jgi:hypothetical protein